MLCVIAFLAIPILGFIFAMKDLRDWKAVCIFTAFYAIYGYAFSFELQSADCFRIARNFYFGYWDISNVWDKFDQGGSTDVYKEFIFAIVKQFTDNPKVLYSVFGLVMGFFACISIAQLYSIWKGKKTIFFYLIVFLFFLHLSFFNLVTTRWYTAASVFVFFGIKFIYFRKKWALIGICITPLIHFSFYFAIAVVLSYEYILKTSRFSKYCYWFMVATFVLSLVRPQSLVDEVMGDEEDQMEMTSNRAINRKVKGYSKSTDNDGPKAEKKVSTYRAANNMFKRATNLVYTFGLVLMSTLFYRKRKHKEIIQDNNHNQLLDFTFYFLGTCNFFSLFVGSAGRFRLLADLFMLLWLCAIFQQNMSVRWKDYVIMMFPIKFYYIAFFFYNAPRVVTPLFWYAPPISTILDGIDFIPDFL